MTIVQCISQLNKNFETQIILNNLNFNKFIFRNLIQEIYKRIYLPLYIPLLSIITSFVILKSNYNFNFKSYKIKVFLIGILLIIFSQISVNTISINSISGVITLLIPIFLIALGMLFLNQ